MKIILIPPCFTYGDCLSVTSLMNYLLEFYDECHLYLGPSPYSLKDYYENYFSADPRFNTRMFLTSNAELLINSGEYGEYHICNVLTGDWLSAKTDFIDLPNVNKDFYFNDLNPLYDRLLIPDEHKAIPNCHLPSLTIEVNHLLYYKLIGLNNTVRMDYFTYFRNLEKEEEYKNAILQQMGIGPNDKYNVINDPIGHSNVVIQHIKNGYPTINLNYLAPCFGYLLGLIEGAEEIHLIEGNNVNFLYHCQYINIFNYNKNIYFHIWVRNRDWLFENMNMDYAWKMMDSPRLNNWVFIFNENELN